MGTGAIRLAECRDVPLDHPERPCARCGRKFKPTIKRRLLCGPCFSGNEPAEAFEHGEMLDIQRKIAKFDLPLIGEFGDGYS